MHQLSKLLLTKLLSGLKTRQMLFAGGLSFSLSIFIPLGFCKSETHFGPAKKFDRAQIMLINLNHTKGSAGYYLLESDRVTKLMVRDLQKTICQIEEVEKTYNRLRKRQDEKMMAPAIAKINLAQQTARQLDEELRDAFLELKTSIKDALVFD